MKESFGAEVVKSGIYVFNCDVAPAPRPLSGSRGRGGGGMGRDKMREREQWCCAIQRTCGALLCAAVWCTAALCCTAQYAMSIVHCKIA